MCNKSPRAVMCGIVICCSILFWGLTNIQVHMTGLSPSTNFVCNFNRQTISKAFESNKTAKDWAESFATLFPWEMNRANRYCFLGTLPPIKRYCPISKNLSRQLLMAFCRQYVTHLLEGSIRISGFGGQSGTNDIDTIYMGCQRFLRDYALSRPETRMSSIESLIIVRDPVERFVSAWLYICGHASESNCFQCPRNDICCFIDRLTHALMTQTLPLEYRNESFPLRKFIVVHLMPQTQFFALNQSTYDQSRTFIDIDSKDRILSYVKGMVGKELIQSGWGVNGAHAFLEEPSWHSTKQYSKSVIKILQRNYIVRDTIQMLYAEDYRIYNLAHVS